MDPIGLAGGLNFYGFASGDPINFSDPFGLLLIPTDNRSQRALNKLRAAAAEASASKDAEIAAAGLALQTMLNDLDASKTNFYLEVSNAGVSTTGRLNDVPGYGVRVNPSMLQSDDLQLAHELGHAVHIARTGSFRPDSPAASDAMAVGLENDYRKILGCKARKGHGTGPLSGWLTGQNPAC